MSPLHSLTVAMMSRITIHLKRFACNPNGVVNQDSNQLPITNRRNLFSPDQIETMPPPAFAARSVPYSQKESFLSGPPNGATTVSGTDSYFAMQTFSTVAAVERYPLTQYSPEPPGASVGSDWVAPRTG